jgi:hypothetical protein
MSDESDQYGMPPRPEDAGVSESDEEMAPSSVPSTTGEETGEFSMPREPGLAYGEPTVSATAPAPEAAPPTGGGGEYEMPPVPKAVRLTFAYEGDNVSVVSRQEVEMIARPSDPVSSREARLGSWIELQGEEETPLYSQVLPEHFTPDVEVFSPEPGESIARQPVEVASGVFSVVVPDIEEAKQVAIFSSRVPPEAVPGVAVSGAEEAGPTEMARFPLHPEGD